MKLIRLLTHKRKDGTSCVWSPRQSPPCRMHTSYGVTFKLVLNPAPFHALSVLLMEAMTLHSGYAALVCITHKVNHKASCDIHAGCGAVQVWVRGSCEAARSHCAAHTKLAGDLGPHAGHQSQAGKTTPLCFIVPNQVVLLCSSARSTPFALLHLLNLPCCALLSV